MNVQNKTRPDVVKNVTKSKIYKTPELVELDPELTNGKNNPNPTERGLGQGLS